MGKLNDITPAELRQLIRDGKVTESTVGLCPGYVQANLIIMPQKYAEDFKEFAKKNPAPCPVPVLPCGSKKRRLSGGVLCFSI